MASFDNIEFACLTDVGVRRSHNQDSYVAAPAGDAKQWCERGHLFVVADGMGAHAVGELASKLAADGITHLFGKYVHEGAAGALRRSFIETNQNIHTKGQQNREFEGMGTTGSALLLRPEGAWIGHVGDSRVYRVRGGKIEQLTFDHSLVWELARRQNCRPEELQGIPHNVIVRSLGPEAQVQVDIEGPHPLQVGDIFVLCSDGLSGPVSEREIGAIVSAMPPAEACRFLVDLANLQGGPDNITALVVRVKAVDLDDVVMTGPTGPSWYEKVPWPMVALAAGILFALLALFLSSRELPGATTVFVLAALAIVGGMVGLLFQARQEKTTEDQPSLPTALHIHRQAECAIQLPMLQKLARAEANLQEKLRARDWQVDWDASLRHREQAQSLMAKGDLSHAFREYCLAMRPLAEAVERERHKEEMFQPVWEKGES